MLPLAIPTAFLGDEALTQGSQGPLRYKLLIQRSIRLAFHTIVRQKKIFGIVSECHTHQLFPFAKFLHFFKGGRIHSSKLKIGGVHIAGEGVESDLFLGSRVKHHLVEEGLVSPAEIGLVTLWHFPRLIV